MESEDSRDASRNDRSSSRSSSSSSSSSRSRRSPSSDRTDQTANTKTTPKSPLLAASKRHPRSPSADSSSQSSSRSASPIKQPRSPDNLSGAHSDINSPENSMPQSPASSKSPNPPKSPSEGSNIASPEHPEQYYSGGEGPKTPQSPSSSLRSDGGSRGSRHASPDSRVASPSRKQEQSRPSSPSPDRNSSPSPARSPVKNEWSPKEKWRRHTKAEQKIMPQTRSRSGSDSSQSSRSSSYNKRSSVKDPATEEISDGEMESDQEDIKAAVTKPKSSNKVDGQEVNISHEDLSDVSDLESTGLDDLKMKSSPSSLHLKQEVQMNGNAITSSHSSPKLDDVAETPKLEKVPQEKTSNTEDGEEQLDFEAEEGECVETKPNEQVNGENENKDADAEEVKAAGRRSRGSSLEEGEVSDEAERRPEESEPRPVCRFYSRGACTWGVSCRFLHPGVTDKGNYNMFEVVRGVPPTQGAPYAPPARDQPPPESAWERGLRTAKEMLRIANKRKEQDIDFEEKKLHLSVGGVVHDPDAELAYAAAAVGASPPRHDLPPAAPHAFGDMYPRGYGPSYRGRYARPPPPPHDERERYYERERGYERDRVYERPPHYDERAVPDELSYHKRRVRSSREVIVQRAEVERREGREAREGRDTRDGGVRDRRETREARGDDWADPWMRAEPAARRRRPPESDESYSSTSSSNSSSRSSRSPGSKRKRRISSSSRQRLSPSVIVRERRMANARATAMNPPAPRRRAPSPSIARQLAANPPAPASHRHKEELEPYGRKATGRSRKRYSRSSSSGSESSSSSSESESDSRSSSSSGSSGAKRARHARLLNAAARPRTTAKTSNLAAAVSANIPSKKENISDKETSGKRRASPISGAPSAKKAAATRREELLKQLKAVEDAIARKRSKT